MSSCRPPPLFRLLRILPPNNCVLCGARPTATSFRQISDFTALADPTSRSERKRELMRRMEEDRREKAASRAGPKQRTPPTSMYTELVSQVESLAAQRYLRSRLRQYPSLTRAREEEMAMRKKWWRWDNRGAKGKQSSSSAVAPTSMPYGAKPDPSMFVANKDSKNEAKVLADEEEEEEGPEGGYFLREDDFQDEYAKGTTAELPEDEMTESPIAYFGNIEDAVEHIEFQLPGQKPLPKKAEKRAKREMAAADEKEIGEWMANYDITEPGEEELADVMLEDANCAGCGANFHCHNPSLPGFVPFQLYKEIEHNSKKIPFHRKTDYICRRCYLLKEYNFLLNLNVAPVDYASIMGHLRFRQEALILLIVDMTDLEASIHRQLPSIIGAKKPMIVIGNKVDLLPPDAHTGYLRHYLSCLKNAVHNAGFTDQFNILKFLLVSAKTGFGVEDLITNIYQKWISPRGSVRSDLYVVGSTNAGKSTLFNAFLQSDLCKVRAMDLVERVTTSIWPGTTLSLLKFPVMNLNANQLEIRRRRLLSMQAWKKKEEAIRRAYFESTKNPKYLTLHGIIDSTFKEREESKQPVDVQRTIDYFTGQLESEEDIGAVEGTVKRKPNMTLNDRTFLRGHWCYDTPGTVNNAQILDLFTLDELINVVPRSMLLPRIFSLQADYTLLVGGVARVDVLDVITIRTKPPPVFFTVFASKRIELNVMPTKDVGGFLNKFLGDPSLGAPIGGPERLAEFPKLESCDFEVENTQEGSADVGLADVVLSSLGWVLITSPAKGVKIRAWTPGGKGLQLRQPPLLPYAASYRASRLPGSRAFRTRPLKDIETFSSTQRTLRPKRIVGENIKAPEGTDEAAQYVNFDLGI